MPLIKYYKKPLTWLNYFGEEQEGTTVQLITNGEIESLVDNVTSEDRKKVTTVSIENETLFKALPSKTLKELVEHLETHYPNLTEIKTDQSNHYTKESLLLLAQYNEINGMLSLIDDSQVGKKSLAEYVTKVYETTFYFSLQDKQDLFEKYTQNLHDEGNMNNLLTKVSHLDNRPTSSHGAFYFNLFGLCLTLTLTALGYPQSILAMGSILINTQRASEIDDVKAEQEEEAFMADASFRI